LHRYSISAAASVVCLDLFQRGSPTSILLAERDEVVAALSTLRSMTSFSAIAARGAALIENLLAEEAKLPALPTSPRSSTKRRRIDADAAPAPAHPQQQSSATSLAKLLASPLAGGHASLEPSGLVFAPGSASSPSSSGTSTGAPPPPAGDIFFAPPAAAAATAAGGLGLSMDVDDLSPLPASFMSAFLETGFDPLDGAIMGGVGSGVGAGAAGGGGELPPWLEVGSPMGPRDEVRA